MSEIKVNKLSPRSGTAVTLGDSGDTFTIPSGATLAIAGSVTGFTSAGIDDNATSVAITIDSSERVGIGTTSPSTTLDVAPSGSDLIGLNIRGRSSDNKSRIEFRTNDNSAVQFQIESAPSAASYIKVVPNQPLIFRTNNTDKMTITGAGNVGIGTSTPTQKLFSAVDSTLPIPTSASMGSSTSGVANGIGIHNTNNSAQYSGLTLETKTSNASRWLIANEWKSNFNGDLVFRSRIDGSLSSEILRLKSDGKIGIGTASPSQTLTVAGDMTVQKSGDNLKADFSNGVNANFRILTSGSVAQIGPSTASDVVFLSGNAEKVRITSAGLVGIGTSSPSEALDVVGNANITNSTNHPNLEIRSTITPTGSTTGGQIKLSLGSGSNSGSGNADTQAGDKLGMILFNGQGTDYSYQGAIIEALVTTGDGNDVRANQGVDLIFGTKTVGASGYAEKARITAAGNVGIGTTSPAATLEVMGTTGANFKYDSSSTYLSILPEDANGDVSLRFRANSGSAPDLLFKNDGGSEVVRIGNNGKVGIGTTSPDAVLQVGALGQSGSVRGAVAIKTVANYTTFGEAGIYIEEASGSEGYYMGVDVSGGMFFNNSGAAGSTMYLSDDDNVGIGTTSPGGQLHIVGSSTTNQVKIENTDGGTASAPDLVLFRNSASPANNDALGRIHFRGKTNTGAENNYAYMYATSGDVTNGSEDGNLFIGGLINGADRSWLTLLEYEVVVNDDSNDLDFRVESNANTHALFVRGSDSSVMIGASSIPTSGTTVNGIQLKGGSDTNFFSVDSSGGQEQMRFINPNGRVGSIRTNGSNTSFETSSDYRLKENVNYDFNATTRLKQLKPARFNFIADADTTVDGFIAHEVQSIIPEAVSGTHNQVEVWKDNEELPEGVSVGDNKLDDDGNTIPYYQGIDQSKLVPLLVKTIQELEARITTLENA